MAANPPSDQEVQFKKRARRRLVGAVALVLLMVTLLPMLLDDKQDAAPPPEIAIAIPDRGDSDFTSRVVPETPAQNSPEAPASPPAAGAPAAPVQQAEEAPAAVVPPPADAAAPPTQAPAAPAVAPAPAPATPYLVQIGVYADSANVKKLQDNLAQQGLKSYTETLQTAQGPRTRLRMGPFDTRADADKALAALKAAGMSGIVVSQ